VNKVTVHIRSDNLDMNIPESNNGSHGTAHAECAFVLNLGKVKAYIDTSYVNYRRIKPVIDKNNKLHFNGE